MGENLSHSQTILHCFAAPTNFFFLFFSIWIALRAKHSLTVLETRQNNKNNNNKQIEQSVNFEQKNYGLMLETEPMRTIIEIDITISENNEAKNENKL